MKLRHWLASLSLSGSRVRDTVSANIPQLLFIAIAVVATPRIEAQAVAADYKLHAGDQLEVSVWKEVDLQREVLIRPDGRFSFPLTGEVQAAGRTPVEIRAFIEEKLREFIPEAEVTVTVKGVNGNSIYVIGQVNKPGAFVMNPQLNVLQALSLAGGMTAFAKLDNIIVVRHTSGAQKALPFEYNRVSEGRDLAQNLMLEAGDVVVVP